MAHLSPHGSRPGPTFAFWFPVQALPWGSCVSLGLGFLTYKMGRFNQICGSVCFTVGFSQICLSRTSRSRWPGEGPLSDFLLPEPTALGNLPRLSRPSEHTWKPEVLPGSAEACSAFVVPDLAPPPLGTACPKPPASPFLILWPLLAGPWSPPPGALLVSSLVSRVSHDLDQLSHSASNMLSSILPGTADTAFCQSWDQAPWFPGALGFGPRGLVWKKVPVPTLRVPHSRHTQLFSPGFPEKFPFEVSFLLSPSFLSFPFSPFFFLLIKVSLRQGANGLLLPPG